MKISGLILAAGFSGRMHSFKPILKINDKPLILVITEKLRSVCDEVVIVAGHNRSLLEESVEKSNRIKFVFNENYRKGMFTSLKKGLSEIYDSDWTLYHFVDQPSLPQIFYQEFVEQISDHYNWIQPEYNFVKGHPILLGQSIYKIILGESDERSLKDVGSNPDIKKFIWECNYPQILSNINTKEDFDKLI
jgi:molybdenum cofactor cytidylyltransferase